MSVFDDYLVLINKHDLWKILLFRNKQQWSCVCHFELSHKNTVILIRWSCSILTIEFRGYNRLISSILFITNKLYSLLLFFFKCYQTNINVERKINVSTYNNSISSQYYYSTTILSSFNINVVALSISLFVDKFEYRRRRRRQSFETIRFEVCFTPIHSHNIVIILLSMQSI